MVSSFTLSGNFALNAILELICVDLQLTETQDRRSRGHYAAVANWLSRNESPLQRFDPHIYPQGSQRLDTTTKPLGQSEFDLDAVCKLLLSRACHPGELYQLIWNCLEENEIYRPMMRRMPRCIRVEYAGDFHLDIAPAIPDDEWGGNCILVPDLDSNLTLSHPENDRWKSTNPLGYAKWFEDQCVPVPMVFDKQARAQVDPVPDKEAVHSKPVLKRSVQLFKRWRDVEYADRSTLAPPSIILTTLSGHFYQNQQLCSDALLSILSRTMHETKLGKRIRLTNPAHPTENICEKWDKNPEAYSDFVNAVGVFHSRWERLQTVRGIQEIEKELSELFGESPVRSAVRSWADRQVVQPRASGLLRVRPHSGALVPAVASPGSLRVHTNNFHGDCG